MAVPESVQPIIDAHTYLVQLRYEHWALYEAYTVVWWLLLSGWLLPWVIWLYLVDRSRIAEIAFYGVKIMFIATLLDAMGTAQTLWIYTIKVIPFTPHLETIDWGIPIFSKLERVYNRSNNRHNSLFLYWRTFYIQSSRELSTASVEKLILFSDILAPRDLAKSQYKISL